MTAPATDKPTADVSAVLSDQKRGVDEVVSIPRSPIVLGISGHLNNRIEDIPALKSALETLFNGLEKSYPNTPLMVMSSLARGADQLAVEVALERNRAQKPGDRKIQIIAPLPFPVNIYRKSSTFTDHEEDAEKLQGFLDSGEVESYVVPLPEALNDDDLDGWERIVRDPDQQRTCYANAGGYVVGRCHALIALWDGAAPAKPSGTAEMVQCKLAGKTPKLFPWKKPLLMGGEKGPVFAICTPRESATEAVTEKPQPAGQITILLPGGDRPLSMHELRLGHDRLGRFSHRLGEATGAGKTRSKAGAKEAAWVEWEQFREICQSIDDFNRDLTRYRQPIMTRIGSLSGSSLWRDADGISIPKSLRTLLILRESAATLAGKLDRPSHLCMRALFVVLFLAGLSFTFYAHWPWSPSRYPTAWKDAMPGDWIHVDPRNLLLITFLLSLAGAVVVVLIAWWYRFSERYLDYRALAEAVRVRIMWGAAGIPESVAESYLGQMRSEIAWARMALKSASPPPAIWQRYFRNLTADVKIARLRTVADLWVRKQRKYFADKMQVHRIGAAKLRSRGFQMALVGWFIALAFVPLAYWHAFESRPLNPQARAAEEGVSPTVATSPGLPASSALSEHLDKPPAAAAKNRRPETEHSGQKWPLIVIGTLVLAGGLLIAYCERRSHEELAKQYERMAKVFSQGEQEIDDLLLANNTEAIQDVMRALGREAIMENAQWLILRRNRPVELLIQ